jgi:hypothetical protein
MEPLGILTLGKHRFPVTIATFRRYIAITVERKERFGWEFDVWTGPPLKRPRNLSERFMFADGVHLEAQSRDIPLPHNGDLLGIAISLKEAFDLVSGDEYFTLYVSEFGDVSDLTLKFVERRGKLYHMMVSALAHHVHERAEPLKVDTWIKRLPAATYGGQTQSSA